MMNKSLKLFHSRKKSFGHAIDGLKTLFGTQANAKIHLGIAFLVIVAGVYFKIALNEWLIVFLLIGLVLIAEAVNTALERIVDLVSPEYNKLAKQAKDLGATSVLISALTAVVIGLLIFIPKILSILPF